MKCPRCEKEMLKFGVTEKGKYRFWCEICYIIREEN